MLFASAWKSASHKKWHVFVCLDRFPWLNYHWIALKLLYSMSLEPSFSIEWFPSYTQLNIGAKIMILHINPVYNALKIITKDKTTCTPPINHARLPWLLKLFERFLEGLFGVLKQPAPMILHILPAQHNHSCWEDTASDRNPSQLNLESWQLHTQWNCVAVPSLAYNMNSWYNVLALWCSTDPIQSYECAFVSPVCVCMGVREWERERERERRREEREAGLLAVNTEFVVL